MQKRAQHSSNSMENILLRIAFELFSFAEVPDENDVQLGAFPRNGDNMLAS